MWLVVLNVLRSGFNPDINSDLSSGLVLPISGISNNNSINLALSYSQPANNINSTLSTAACKYTLRILSILPLMPLASSVIISFGPLSLMSCPATFIDFTFSCNMPYKFWIFAISAIAFPPNVIADIILNKSALLDKLYSLLPFVYLSKFIPSTSTLEYKSIKAFSVFGGNFTSDTWSPSPSPSNSLKINIGFSSTALLLL